MTKLLTLVLRETPIDSRADEIARDFAKVYGDGYTELEWTLARELPPQINVAQEDQLYAHLRDAGVDATFMLVELI
jgi:hypothetical protein